jgi:hypothetical protein
MHWVYILKCQNDHYYIGETTRLYRRFWEHNSGKGGVNTYTYTPETVVAIYKVNMLGMFFEYDYLIDGAIEGGCDYKPYKLKKFDDKLDDYDYNGRDVENNITECLMIHNKETWNKIRGGKYTHFNVTYKFPINDNIQNLPICKCGLPCDVKKNQEKNYLFFRCAKKNMWEEFKEQFDIDEEPCNFYMEYSRDKPFKLEETKKFEDRKRILKELFKKSFWLKNIPECDNTEPDVCIGCCNKGYDYTKVTYSYKERNLCFDCFIDKNDELSKKYTIISEGKCLLKFKK